MIRIGINGFGRIGRTLARVVWQRPDLDIDVVVVNDVQPVEQLAYLLEFDSVAGRLPEPVEVAANVIRSGDRSLPVLQAPTPEEVPWREFGVDVVVESARRFAQADEARRHLEGGAPAVVVSAPSEGADATIVVGVNDDVFDPTAHRVISNASCTTNCLAPMIQVLDDAFGVDHGFVTTVHAYTSEQALVDGAATRGRQARAAAVSIVPTTTGAARAIGLVLPHLAGRLDGSSLRVPVPDGSITDLTAVLREKATVRDINEAFRAAATARLAGIVEYSDREIVSADILGNSASCVFDAPLTNVSDGGRTAKVFGWYDNEWAYSHRLAELATIVARGRADLAA